MSKAAIFLADGFETIEALTVVDLCRRAGIELPTVSVTDTKRVISSHKVPVEADMVIADLDFDSIEMIILPGGMPGTPNLEDCDLLMQKIDEFAAADRFLSAICAAPRILGKKGLLEGKTATCYPGVESFLAGANYTGGKVEIDGIYITGRGMGTANEFALAIVERLAGKEKADEVAKGVTFER